MTADDFFALPAFRAAEALVQLKRQLCDMKLAERGSGFEWKGRDVVTLAATDTVIEARLVQRPARSPEWTAHALKSGADVRRFVETVKRQLDRWTDED